MESIKISTDIQDRSRVIRSYNHLFPGWNWTLQLNYRTTNWRLSEQKPYNWLFMDEATSRLTKIVERRKGLAPHSLWPLRIWRNISAAKSPTKECGVSVPWWTPQPRAPYLGKDAHIPLGYKNQGGLCPSGRDKEFVTNPSPLLKDQYTKSHLQLITPGSGRGRVAQSTLESFEACVPLGREQMINPQCWTPFPHHPQMPSFLGQAFPSIWHQVGGIQLPHPSNSLSSYSTNSCPTVESASWVPGVEVWSDSGVRD